MVPWDLTDIDGEDIPFSSVTLFFALLSQLSSSSLTITFEDTFREPGSLFNHVAKTRIFLIIWEHFGDDYKIISRYYILLTMNTECSTISPFSSNQFSFIINIYFKCCRIESHVKIQTNDYLLPYTKKRRRKIFFQVNQAFWSNDPFRAWFIFLVPSKGSLQTKLDLWL